MIKKTQLFSLIGLGIALACCQGQADDKENYSSRQDKSMQVSEGQSFAETQDQIDMKMLSEAFGHFIGRNLHSPGLSFDLESLIKGIREGAAGKPAPLSDKEYEEMMAAVQEKAFREMSSSNLKNANDFMERNQHDRGIVVLVPGKLQYSILTEGIGEEVKEGFSPKIHYTGKYQDGTVFGTSEELGGPITIPLNQTIPGFSKGIVGMKEGEKRRLFVHPDLGYGTTGQLPPNELLIFDVEVVKADTKDENPEEKDEDNDDRFHDDDESESEKR